MEEHVLLPSAGRKTLRASFFALLLIGGLGLSACGKENAAGSGAGGASSGSVIPAELASSCIFASAPAGYPSVFGASLSKLAEALQRPDASFSWEKSATGYILRQTVADQLSGSTSVNSFSLRPVDEAQTKASLMGVTDNPFQCGPKGLYVDRSIVGGRELDAAQTWSLLIELIGRLPSKKPGQAAAAPATADPAQAISANEFPRELDAMYVPAEKTVAGVVAMARDVCHRTGTDEAPATLEVVVEWAEAKTTLYDLAVKHGFKMSSDDDKCYKDGQDALRSAHANSATDDPQ